MTTPLALLLALGVCLAGLVLVRDWRAGLLLLFGAALPLAGFVWTEAAPVGGRLAAGSAALLALIDLVSALTAALILLVSSLSYTDESNVEDVDELGDLCWPTQHALHLEARTRWSGYLMPALGLALVVVATLLLPRLYPFAPRPVHYAWTLTLLSGVLLLVEAGTLLRVGLGLLLLVWGIKLLYITSAGRVGLMELALLNLVAIGLSLTVAYLSNLLFARFKAPDAEPMLSEAERE